MILATVCRINPKTGKIKFYSIDHVLMVEIKKEMQLGIIQSKNTDGAFIHTTRQSVGCNYETIYVGPSHRQTIRDDRVYYFGAESG